jgi:hypothetical protein
MVTWKQLKAAILARRAAQGPRKKRTRPEPRQYTVADLERARDRVAAAERRIDNDRSSNPNRGRAGLERAQLELAVIEAQLRLRGLLRDDDDDEGKTRPGNQAHDDTPFTGVSRQRLRPSVMLSKNCAHVGPSAPGCRSVMSGSTRTKSTD